MFLLFVFLLIHIENFAYIVTIPFFLLPQELIFLWLIFWHFFAISPSQSIQFWYSPFVQSLFFCFYYPSFHLSSHLYKDSYGNKFFISFLLSWAHNEISNASPMPRFPPNFTASEKQLWITESGQHSQEQKVLQFWHCNPILLQLMALQAAIWFADLGKGTGISHPLQGLMINSFGRSHSFSKLFLSV